MIGVYIRPTGMTGEQYQRVDDQLRASGVEPKGMKMHSCFGEGEGIAIFDVWETEEEFTAFAAHLTPIVAAAGLEPITPMFVPMIAFRGAVEGQARRAAKGARRSTEAAQTAAVAAALDVASSPRSRWTRAATEIPAALKAHSGAAMAVPMRTSARRITAVVMAGRIVRRHHFEQQGDVRRCLPGIGDPAQRFGQRRQGQHDQAMVLARVAPLVLDDRGQLG